MKPESRDDSRAYDRASLLKTGGLAVALAVATWLLAPLLLPVKVPQDFPNLPDLQSAHPDLRAALQTADSEARRRPGSADAVGKLGMAYHANLFVEQAARAYRIAARLSPRDYRWVYYQAVLEEEGGHDDRQSQLLQQTLRLKPDLAVARLKLADWYFKRDMLDEAAQAYGMAAGAPDSVAFLPSTFGLGRVAARRRDWNKVVESITPLSQVYSYSRPPYELLQEAYEALGRPDKAAEARQRAAMAELKVVPPPDDPLNQQLTDLCFSATRLLKQAGLLSRIGYNDRAIQVARRAALVDPTDPDARYFLAHTLITRFGEKPDAVDDAVTQLAECLRLRPDDLAPLWNFTKDFFASPRTGTPVQRLHALLRARAKSPEAPLSLGMAAEAQGEMTEAVSQYQAALKNNPNDSVAHNSLGQLFDRAGNYGEAFSHFQKAAQLDPLNAVLRRNLGIVLVQQGKYDRGIKEFGEGLRLNPYDVASLLGMGFALLELNRTDEAVPIFRDAVRCKPDSPEGHYGLGFASFKLSRRDDALAEVREALRLRPDFAEAQAVLHQLGQ
ncbi:MAG: tetratricopeptide repeat protein [Candidatus Solibacter sp.]